MAINLLGSIPNTPVNPQALYGKQSPQVPQQPNATSMATKQPVYVPPPTQTSTPMGVTAKSPLNNVSVPKTVLPPNQVDKTQTTIDPTTGLLKNAANANQNQNQNQNTNSTILPPPPSSNPYIGALGAASLAGSPAAAGTTSQLQSDIDQLNKLQQATTQGTYNVQTKPMLGEFQQGQIGAIQQAYGGQEQALANKISAEQGLLGTQVTAQGQVQSGLNQAGQLAQPVTQFGQLTNPQTGAVVSPNGGNPQLNTAVQQAMQLIQNGATTQDAITASGLSAFGVPGTQALTSALQGGGTYNPSAVDATATQNLTQGKTYQGVAQELSNALQTMQPIGDKLTAFITATGQNPETAPLVNEQINKVNSQLYPAQAATLAAAVNDIRSYAIQILGSQSGANPTDVTNGVNSFDFTNFSAKDLQAFLGDLQNMGMTRLSQAQSAMKAGYGANNIGNGPAAGITATDTGGFNTGSVKPSTATSNIGKAVLGTIANVAQGIAGAAGNAVSSATGGAVGGAAAELFLP